ncbi:MAG: hypothetical protein NHG09_00705 [Candidatus Shikimatogenerans sp. JK-2022]|nr:hypothetical protein [Candidatus Shikimatogenerans bostrichidophilus]
MFKKKIYKNWYIIKIQNKFENYIKERILKILKENNIKIYYFFNPYFIKSKFKKGKKYIKKKNILPGYLILNIFLNNFIFFKIKKIKGVIFFLNERKNNLPLSLNYNEIKNFFKKFKIIKKKKDKKKINIGENIKIKKGIFKNIEGKIFKKKKKYIYIYIKIMGKNVPIKIKYKYI